MAKLERSWVPGFGRPRFSGGPRPFRLFSVVFSVTMFLAVPNVFLTNTRALRLPFASAFRLVVSPSALDALVSFLFDGVLCG